MNVAQHIVGAIGLAALCAATPANAQNSYLGQIITVGFAFCPAGTLEANGQLLPIGSYPALFSLYGPTYGVTGAPRSRCPTPAGAAASVRAPAPGSRRIN